MPNQYCPNYLASVSSGSPATIGSTAIGGDIAPTTVQGTPSKTNVGPSGTGAAGAGRRPGRRPGGRPGRKVAIGTLTETGTKSTLPISKTMIMLIGSAPLATTGTVSSEVPVPFIKNPDTSRPATSNSDKADNARIILAVLIPVACFIIVLLIFLLIKRSLRQKREKKAEEYPSPFPSQSQISDLSGTPAINENGTAQNRTSEKRNLHHRDGENVVEDISRNKGMGTEREVGTQEELWLDNLGGNDVPELQEQILDLEARLAMMEVQQLSYAPPDYDSIDRE